MVPDLISWAIVKNALEGGGDIVNESVDDLKLLMGRPQPSKLHDDDPKKRMMTESG